MSLKTFRWLVKPRNYPEHAVVFKAKNEEAATREIQPKRIQIKSRIGLEQERLERGRLARKINNAQFGALTLSREAPPFVPLKEIQLPAL